MGYVLVLNLMGAIKTIHTGMIVIREVLRQLKVMTPRAKKRETPARRI